MPPFLFSNGAIAPFCGISFSSYWPGLGGAGGKVLGRRAFISTGAIVLRPGGLCIDCTSVVGWVMRSGLTTKIGVSLPPCSRKNVKRAMSILALSELSGRFALYRNFLRCTPPPISKKVKIANVIFGGSLPRSHFVSHPSPIE